MGHIVFLKSRKVSSLEDEHVDLIKEQCFKKETPQEIREYGRLWGWILSWFGITFKAYDHLGDPVYLSQKDFCRWLLDLKEYERVKTRFLRETPQATNPDLIHIEPPFEEHEELKEHIFAPSGDLGHVIDIFKREMGHLQALGNGQAPSLVALCDVMREELFREIEKVEQEFYPEEEYVKRVDES